jgi:hypothetical protein
LRKFVFIALAAVAGLALAAAALGHAQATGARSAATIQTVFGLTNNGRLVSFDQGSPFKLLSKVRVTGLAAGEQLLGIDFRPANGKLYGLSNRGQLYVIDHVTGAASKVGNPIQPALDPGPIGFDFNPVVDRIRVVGAQGQNLRLNPDTGAVAAVDGRTAGWPSRPAMSTRASSPVSPARVTPTQTTTRLPAPPCSTSTWRRTCL